MRTPLVVLVSVALLAGCGEGTEGGEAGTTAGDSAVASPFEDPDVARIHRRMMDTLAPDRGWERARYLRFDWVVEREEGEPSRRFHRWDRYSGLYRLESPTDDGTMVALFDVDKPLEGHVWLDGDLTEGARRRDLLDRAHAVFVNDTYWLLMPYKWDDPGVQAEYLGRETDDDGQTWEVVRLSFERGVGRTPRNVYHAWIDPETGIMRRWYHFRTEGAEPLISEWEEWRRVGPLLLAGERSLRGQDTVIRFANLEVSEDVPPGAFRPPPGAELPEDTTTRDSAAATGR